MDGKHVRLIELSLSDLTKLQAVNKNLQILPVSVPRRKGAID
jgi:hypothetical protein